MATKFEDSLDIGLGLGQYNNIKNSFKNYRQIPANSSSNNDIHSTSLTLGLSSSPKSEDSSMLSHVIMNCDEFVEELGRKKLRLSKDQSRLLEEKFKEHSTLNPKQKQALAKHLHLQPRQVEVWFQNRRARTKLKQTEVDREFYRKCYEKLTEENQRLKTELEELKKLKMSSPLAMYLPMAPSITVCPSCQCVNGASEGPFTVGHTAQFLNNNNAFAKPTQC